LSEKFDIPFPFVPSIDYIFDLINNEYPSSTNEYFDQQTNDFLCKLEYDKEIKGDGIRIMDYINGSYLLHQFKDGKTINEITVNWSEVKSIIEKWQKQ
jgi:hypothetical protein